MLAIYIKKDLKMVKSVIKRLEYLVVTIGVEIYYDAKEEWFTVHLGNNAKFSNIDLAETIHIAYEWFIKENG